MVDVVGIGEFIVVAEFWGGGSGPGEGDGLGLSICYGIAREHGGEISTFNPHPRGTGIVVEVPVGEVVRQEQAA